MALEGSIKDFGLAEIFQLIYLQRKTGELTLRGQKDHANILFENGLIVDAASTERGAVEKLGEILVRANRIKEEQLDEFIKDQQIAKDRLGEILSESGLIKNEDIKKALSLQKHELIYSLFRWKDGNYHFDQNVKPPKHEIPPLNTEFILMEGIRRLDEWPFMEKVLHSKGLILNQVNDKKKLIQVKEGDSEIDFDIFNEVSESAQTSPGYTLKADEYEVYNLVDGERDVRTLIKISPYDDFETSKILSNLITAGIIEIVGENKVKNEKKKGVRKKTYENPKIKSLIINGLVSVPIVMVIIFGGYKFYLNKNINYSNLIIEILKENRKETIQNQIELYKLRKDEYPKSIDKFFKEKEWVSPDDFQYEVSETGYKIK